MALLGSWAVNSARSAGPAHNAGAFPGGISENAVAHTEASGQAAGAGQNSLFKAGMFKSNRMFKPNASETLSSQAFRNDTGRKADMEVVKRMLLSPSSRHFIYRIHI